jgi:glycosyltransferase involved in cell wall biosynthesis
MHLAIDLRGLNYQKRTGVNTFTLHALYCLRRIKKKFSGELVVTAVGVDAAIFTSLKQEFEFLNELFDENISLGEYIGLPHLGWRKGAQLWIFFLNTLGVIRWSGVKNFDVLLMPQPKPILLGKTARLISMFHDLYSIHNKHNLSWFQRIVENENIYRIVAHASQKVIANSISTANDIEKLLSISHENIKLMYPALPIWSALKGQKESEQPIRNEILESVKNHYFLFLSGIERRKNLINLVRGYKLFQENLSNQVFQLVIAGSIVDANYLQEIQHFITENHLKNITFLFEVNESEKENLMKNCYAFVYPSLYEGFGFPILESFNHNKPVITSITGSMPELAKYGAVYVNPFVPHDISNAMEILVRDREYYNELIVNIKKQKNDFSWSEMEIELIQMLKMI